MGSNGIYPPVNVYIAMERSTMLFMGKLTINMTMFNSYVTNNQRVDVSFHRCILILDILLKGSEFLNIINKIAPGKLS